MEENNANQEMNLQGEQVQAENQPVVTQETVQQVSPITIEQNQIAAVQSQETVQNQPELNQSTNTTEEFLKAKKHLKLEFLIIGIQICKILENFIKALIMF